MDKINFQFKPKTDKKVTWYDTVKIVSDRLKEDQRKMMGLFRGWDQRAIYELIRWAENTVKDGKNINFGKAFWWHYHEVIGHKATQNRNKA